MKKKTWHLTCYLIKESVSSFKDCLRNDFTYNNYKLNSKIKYEGVIIIGESKEKSPRWVKFLEEASVSPFDQIKNQSTRAILFLKTKSRIFAFTFGYGRYLLKDELIVNDFGFKIAINAIDPKQIRSLDTAKLEELTVQSRIQTSIGSEKETFGIDILNDLLRAVTGVPKNQRFAKQIAGRDGIIINAEQSVHDLEKKARIMLHHYTSSRYKKDFDWVDNLREERNKLLINELRKMLISDLNSKNSEKMILAPDKVIDWDDINGFCYKKNYDENALISELHIEHFLNNVAQLNDYDELKKERIYVNFASNDLTIKWSVYKCLTYETDYKNSKYIFTLGRWYKIETNFVKTVVDYVKTIPLSSFKFPNCDVKTEGEYNNKFMNTKDCYVLDKMTVKCDSARTEIEPCDILTKTLQFIHVKQKHNSTNLSHLFSQCRISAESLIKDEGFRKAIREKAKKKLNYDLSFIPVDNTFKASDCEIVIAIISKGDKPIEKALPFFSLLNLRQSVIMLKAFNYKVSVALIEKV